MTSPPKFFGCTLEVIVEAEKPIFTARTSDGSAYHFNLPNYFFIFIIISRSWRHPFIQWHIANIFCQWIHYLSSCFFLRLRLVSVAFCSSAEVISQLFSSVNWNESIISIWSVSSRTSILFSRNFKWILQQTFHFVIFDSEWEWNDAFQSSWVLQLFQFPSRKAKFFVSTF